MESDKFDDFCRHLIIIDHKNSKQFPNGKIIGVSRLMLTEDSENGIGFYCSQEFNLNPMISTKKECLENEDCLGFSVKDGNPHCLKTKLSTKSEKENYNF